MLKKISEFSKYFIFNFLINLKIFLIFPCSKRFLISIIILSLIALYSFSSLKKFLMFLIMVSNAPFFFSFSNLNRFPTSLIMFSLQVLDFPLLYVKTKIN